MEDFLLNTLNGIKQWASKFWEKDETTYSEWGFHDSGTQALGKTIVTPLYGNLKKVTLVVNSCGTPSGWIDLYYRLPYVPNIRLEGVNWFGWNNVGSVNGTDFRVTLMTYQNQPVFKINHLVNGEPGAWNGETLSFAIEYVTVVNPAV
jgi:hypothetical protein